MVVMDEFHFYGDPDRGWAWQVPLLELPRAQFLLMSATLGDVPFLESDLTRRTGRRPRSSPTPSGRCRCTTTTRRRRCTRRSRSCSTAAGADLRRALHPGVGAGAGAGADERQRRAPRRRRRAIAELIGGFRFSSAFGATLSRLVRHGIGVHHAGCCPSTGGWSSSWRRPGCSRSSAAPTPSASGINVPIRTVLFSALSKYDGTRTRLLSAREFHQIAGRAGRAGFDTAGTVVVAGARARGGEPQAVRQGRRRSEEAPKAGAPQELPRAWCRGARRPSTGWSRPPARAADQPHARSSTAMILDVVARPGDPFVAMRTAAHREPRDRADASSG